MRSPERLERREYKYLVDENTVAGIREALLPFCNLDSYAVRHPSRRYTIESLYFDTPTFALFVANQHELVDRFKLRIRHYPSVGDGPIFLEVKRRYNDVILKTRGRLLRNQLFDLFEKTGAEIPTTITGANHRAVERFMSLAHSYFARPVTMVRYEREAWVSQIDDYARVTFDQQIRSQLHNKMSFEIQPGKWRRMDNPHMQQSLSSMTVVEFKFTSAVPRWMMSIIQNFNLFRSSFSKYGTSILSWYLAPISLTPKYRGVSI